MAALNGKWSCWSFCPQPGTATTPPQIAALWAPPGVLEVTTDGSGQVTGTLTFAPGVALNVTGAVTAALENLPEGIELTGEGLSAVYKIRGFFITGGKHVVGTVVAIQNDLAKQPVGTAGPFILFQP
ncbi:hypothetical protein [uncultured Lamprocystis sp.]|jgi:hypothetical protein|uniref:hypothetical protein n=1 Tax=uncultured Lamprocystis sp. TaxID=543132 RepID=UPI0025F543A6|nr:hypothetical protein [uncultured Lamprocystis sp.]